ncbi:hypothetical protein LLT6_14615 [Lactococcus cremoris subsp. cremoris TIFN6]|uniref:Uncharacterized protein n=1 Tax=Lactococcus cremoris subsp. cremoris TIFN6 TaxID=1234876 RepID=T0S5V5_LACLC|nr:hypothetical protein LLT6_14615 [Lactococcus cremoris subsp. cremoris TIFN6]
MVLTNDLLGGVVVPPHFSKFQKFFEFFPALPLGKIASNFKKSTFGAFCVFNFYSLVALVAPLVHGNLEQKTICLK